MDMNDRNVWGTPREWINPDEFCQDCEREVPNGHYDNCPRYSRPRLTSEWV